MEIAADPGHAGGETGTVHGDFHQLFPVSFLTSATIRMRFAHSCAGSSNDRNLASSGLYAANHLLNFLLSMDLGAVNDGKFLKLELVPLVHYGNNDSILFFFLQPFCSYDRK